MKFRTFIAVEIESQLRCALAEVQEQLRPLGRNVKWIEPGNFHLTLKFLGDVEDAGLGDVVSAVEKCAAESSSFILAVRGCSAFPNLRSPRVIVARGHEPTGALAGLHETLESALAGLGFKRERRSFRPHLTLGRVRRGSPGRAFAEHLATLAEIELGEQNVRALMAMTSELTPNGPVYTKTAEAVLG